MKRLLSYVLSFMVLSNQLVQFTFAEDITTEYTLSSPELINISTQDRESVEQDISLIDPIVSSGSQSTGTEDQTDVVSNVIQEDNSVDQRISTEDIDGKSQPISIDGELNTSNIGLVCDPSAVYCDLSSLGLVGIVSGTFLGYSNLETLILYDNDITSLTPGMFLGLDNLKTLVMSNNQISELESGVFEGLTSLTSINLYVNPIKIIRSHAFQGLNSLMSLGLENIGIETIESEAFIGLQNLTYLGLYSNQIETLTGGVFSGLSSLTQLGIQANPIKYIKTNAFNGISNISNLDLSGFPIQSIESYAFSGMVLLHQLNINGTSLSDLPNYIFGGLPSLVSIYMQGNPFKVIHEYTFAGLTNLQGLYLAGNQISSIESNSFKDLTSISQVQFGGNRLNADILPNDIVLFLDTYDDPNRKNLQTVVGCTNSLAANYNPNANQDDGSCEDVVLTNQNIQYLCDPSSTICDMGGYNIASITADAFSGYGNLEYIYLNNNDLTSLPVGLFATTPNLLELDIGYNNISSLPIGLFSNTPNLQYLVLIHNNISGLPIGLFSDTPNLTDLDMGENKVVNIEDIKKADLTNLQNLYLAGNHIKKIKSTDFTDISMLSSLDLGQNGILEVEPGAFGFDTPNSGGEGEVISVGYVNLDGNCIDLELGSGFVTSAVNMGSQYSCIDVVYSPTTQTSGPVTGTLTFIGGASSIRDLLFAKYPQINTYTHTWIDNGLYTFDLSFLSDWESSGEITTLSKIPEASVYDIWQYQLGLDSLAANVSWIVASPGSDKTSTSGGGSIKTKDRCLDGDLSDNYYDGKCKAVKEGSDKQSIDNKNIHGTAEEGSTVIAEDLKKAYQWAHTWGITTQKNIEKARVQDSLTRGELAKMIVMYAKEIFGKGIVNNEKAVFNDLDGQTNEIKGYIEEAYKMGLMGIGINHFNPNGKVSRGEFATILARLLYPKENLIGNTYFDRPIELLKKDGIISNTDSNLEEARGYVMLMMMRAKK